MDTILEVRYLAIKWSDEDTAIKIDESRDIIPIEKISSNKFFMQSVAFTKVYYYLGFYLKDDVKHIPYFITDGKRKELTPFRSPQTNKVWWIQSSGWDSKKKCHLSEVYRTAGYLNLVIQNSEVVIQNNYIDFTAEELEHYLSDFKNDLWMLILDKNNPVTANLSRGVPSFFNDKIISLLKEFIEHCEELLKQPNMHLSERLNTLPIKKVKPVPRTFREVLVNPIRKTAASRDFYESYDTPENRYIFYCVSRVFYLLKSFQRLSESQISLFNMKLEKELRWYEKLSTIEKKTVNKDVLKYEISTLKKSLNNLESLKIKQITQPKIVKITLGQRYTYPGQPDHTFFIESINEVHKPGFKKKWNLDSILITFDELVKNSKFDIKLFEKNVKSFSVSGEFDWSETKTFRSGKKYRLCLIEELNFLDFDISKTKLVEEKNRLERKYEELEAKGWRESLSKNEQDYKDKELKVISKKIDAFSKAKSDVEDFSKSLPFVITRFKNVIKTLEAYKVQKRSSFPNSMVFIQNPVYAGCRTLFKEIINSNNLDSGLLNAMMQIDEISLVNTSNLYERWCLVQIIKTLKNEYNFIPQQKWQEILVKSILSSKNVRNVELIFKSQTGVQEIKLTYEKVLSSGKRPDFVLDLYLENDADFNTPKRRLVLDAKLKDFRQIGHDKLINQLYFPLDDTDTNIPSYERHKNYSENYTNQVFIIHPKPRVIENPTSPLGWGRYCDYGQSNKRDFQYGGIFLSPSFEHPHSIDNLKRLIGLYLQRYFVEPCGDVGDKGFNWKYLFCISCGNQTAEDFKLIKKKTGASNDRNTKWETTCLKCNHFTLLTLCYECRNPNQPILKNGFKWTYNSPRAEEISNLVCSNCENFL